MEKKKKNYKDKINRTSIPVANQGYLLVVVMVTLQ